jgi:FkbM family methyltransferase
MIEKRRVASRPTVGGKAFVQTKSNKPGFAVVGPFNPYKPGTYSVAFRIVPDGDPVEGDGFCGWADIVSAAPKTVLEKTNLFADRLRRDNGQVLLTFTLPRAARVRFRVYSEGALPMKIGPDPVVSSISTNGYSPILHPSVQVNNALFTKYFPRFRVMHENGIDIAIGERIVATCRGMSFYICSPDACQLAQGILYGNMYNFLSNRKALVVDVGMNIGLTALYLARDPGIAEVHGFEPFRVPFDRAIDNFALNPELSKKITPVNIGLGASNERLTVLADPEKTIGQSIQGFPTGKPEIITIRNAAEVFQELLSRAEKHGLEVVAKIDCEGSEFPIFESLTKSGVLPRIRAIMTEWHKKGSPDRSRKNIIAPLIGNNFMIFDRTKANQASGMLYAVRTA